MTTQEEWKVQALKHMHHAPGMGSGPACQVVHAHRLHARTHDTCDLHNNNIIVHAHNNVPVHAHVHAQLWNCECVCVCVCMGACALIEKFQSTGSWHS